jgi:hypothetical protein
MSSLSLFVRIAPASNQFLQLALGGKKKQRIGVAASGPDFAICINCFALRTRLRCGRGPD